jgi:hypothetical protein
LGKLLNLVKRQLVKISEVSRMQLINKFSIQFYYGHREILLNYSKLDPTCLLIGIVQHGVGPAETLSSDWPTPRYRSLKRSSQWVYSKVVAADLVAEGARNVTAIGSPWLYSKRLDQYQSKAQPSKLKFIVFPRHYSFSYLSKVTSADILEKIKGWKIIAGSAELEICLYWTEFMNPMWQKIAREEGITLVCAGVSQSIPDWSPTDVRVNFYRNLRQIIEPATHCIFESFTSAVFYAKDLGKNVGIFHSRSSLGEMNRELGFQKENDWLLRNIPGIFNTFDDTPVLESLTRELLGYEELLSPENLARALRYRRGIIPKQLE